MTVKKKKEQKQLKRKNQCYDRTESLTFKSMFLWTHVSTGTMWLGCVALSDDTGSGVSRKTPSRVITPNGAECTLTE